MKSNESKDNRILNIVVGALLILLVVFIGYLFVNAQNNSEPTELLNIGVEKNSTGISLVNHDEGILTGCKVTINNKYSTKVQTIDSENRTYAYEEFLDNDSSKFSILNTEPTELYISECKESLNAFAAYNW